MPPPPDPRTAKERQPRWTDFTNRYGSRSTRSGAAAGWPWPSPGGCACSAGWSSRSSPTPTNRSRGCSSRCSRSCPTRSGSPVQEREGDLNRVKQTLTSSENLAKVVRRTELNSLVASERDLAVQVAGLRESIKVIAQPDNMFEISATAKRLRLLQPPERQAVGGDRPGPARHLRRAESRRRPRRGQPEPRLPRRSS